MFGASFSRQERGRLHVLVVPYSYPTLVSPIDAIFIRNQALALHASGVVVGVIYPEFRSIRSIFRGNPFSNRFQTRFYDEQGIRTIRFHGWNLPKLSLSARLWVRSVLKLLTLYIERFGAPDLIHAHNAMWAGCAALIAKRVHQIPYVITEHSTGYMRGIVSARDCEFTKRVFSDATAIVSVSDSLRNHISAYASRRDIKIVPNVVDSDFFTLPTADRMAAPFRFLSIATLTPKKAVDNLIRAFSCAFNGQAPVVLEVGGAGPERRRLEKLVEQLGIGAQVRFLGMLTPSEVRQAMWRSNAFVLPSHFETFGVVLIEAMATGLFTIATRSGGPEEIVTTDAGILVGKGDVAGLSDALRTAYHMQRFDSHKIRQLAEERFGRPSFCKAISAVYREALGINNAEA